MLPETRDTIVKMMRLQETPSTEITDSVPAWKKIPSGLTAKVNAMEICMGNITKQRGYRWETLASVVADFVVADMKSDGGEVDKKSPGIKKGTPISVIMGRQRPKGVYLEKDGEMYLVQLEQDDEPISIDPAKVIIKG